MVTALSRLSNFTLNEVWLNINIGDQIDDKHVIAGPTAGSSNSSFGLDGRYLLLGSEECEFVTVNLSPAYSWNVEEDLHEIAPHQPEPMWRPAKDKCVPQHCKEGNDTPYDF